MSRAFELVPLQSGHNHRLRHQQPRIRLPRRLISRHCDLYRTRAVIQHSDWAQQPDRGSNPDADSDIWSALDVVGWVGSVAGTAAFILTQELWLVALPVLMPLLALYASRKKQAHLSEVRLLAVAATTPLALHRLPPSARLPRHSSCKPAFRSSSPLSWSPCVGSCRALQPSSQN